MRLVVETFYTQQRLGTRPRRGFAPKFDFNRDVATWSTARQCSTDVHADVDDATNGRERRANDHARDDAGGDDRDGVGVDDAMWIRGWDARETRGMGGARDGDRGARTRICGGGDAEIFRAGAVCE